MIAVIPVRDGVAPTGADETICEASGQALIIGSGTKQALETLGGVATNVWLAEADANAAQIIAAIDQIGRLNDSIILPATPDGRDLTTSRPCPESRALCRSHFNHRQQSQRVTPRWTFHCRLPADFCVCRNLADWYSWR